MCRIGFYDEGKVERSFKNLSHTMGKVFAYARVSTPRQGKGVSLPEQKAAIERYAEQHGLEIVRWFEEQETASKQGRPVFNQMLRLLRLRVARGVIIHKIDRSVRNLEDWNLIGKLVDADVDVHFATESLDLKTLSGRFAADIQAVVATYYSRNLREEVKKGLYGRLKQGIYPFGAPIGYLDQGSGKPKVFDPIRAPLIRTAFELYCTGKYSLHALAKEMFDRGLRNRNGMRVSVTGWTIILKSSFYIGILRVAGQTFSGSHEPLIATELFENVQRVLAGKNVDRAANEIFIYSRIAQCGSCGYSLIAERKKGHIYYRCHNRPFKNPPVCPSTSIREEAIDAIVHETLAKITLSHEEFAIARECITETRIKRNQARATAEQALTLQRDQIQSRLAKLTDLMLDGAVDQALFDAKRKMLLLEQASVAEKLTDLKAGSDRAIEKAEKTVELAKNASFLYKSASLDDKRRLLKTVLSNLTVSRKKVAISLSDPFRSMAERETVMGGAPERGSCRTWESITKVLIEHFTHNPALMQ